LQRDALVTHCVQDATIIVFIAGAIEPGYRGVVARPARKGLEGKARAVALPGIIAVDGGQQVGDLIAGPNQVLDGGVHHLAIYVVNVADAEGPPCADHNGVASHGEKHRLRILATNAIAIAETVFTFKVEPSIPELQRPNGYVLVGDGPSGKPVFRGVGMLFAQLTPVLHKFQLVLLSEVSLGLLIVVRLCRRRVTTAK